MEQEHATKEELRTAISRNPMTGLKNVDVVICRVRQKLKSYGVKVINIWGQGYALDKKARDKIDRLLAPQSKPKAPEPGLFENPRAP
jgi:hypothetical protein